MKQIYAYLLLGLGCLGAVAARAADNRVPFFLAKPTPTPTPWATALNIEHPFRCENKEFGTQEISNTIFVSNKDFQLNRFADGDALPRFEVNGFTFDNLPVDEALQTLVDEAGITVYAEDKAYPEINGNNVYGELSQVVDELSKTGGVFYQYNEKTKSLYLTKTARFEMQLPKNKLVMFAILDAVRGADITTAVPDWGKYTIMFTLNREQEKIVRDLSAGILEESKLLLLNVAVYRVDAKGADLKWQDFIDKFGVKKLNAANAGLIGKLLTMGHQKNADSFMALLGQKYQVHKMSQGMAVVPDTWKMRFDVGRCSFTPNDVNSLSLLLTTNIQSSDVIETDITLDTLRGEVTSFNSVSGLDDEMVIVGIPSSVTNTARTGEMVVTLKVRLIRLIAEGKK